MYDQTHSLLFYFRLLHYDADDDDDNHERTRHNGSEEDDEHGEEQMHSQRSRRITFSGRHALTQLY